MSEHRPALPPLREFDFMGRTLILEHKLRPLVEDGIIHGLENNHDVTTMWTTDSRNESTTIPVTTFRVLFGVREFADFVLTDEWDICEDTPEAQLIKDCSQGTKFTDHIYDVVQRKKREAAKAA